MQLSEVPRHCLLRAGQVVSELEQRSKAAAFEAAALASARAQLAALEAQRRDALRGIEAGLATAAARLDDRAAEQRLKQVRLVEEAYEVGVCVACACRFWRCRSGGGWLALCAVDCGVRGRRLL